MSAFPTLPWGRLDPREHREPYLVEAEAWAWRCADTMPDTEQSRRDAEADADSFVRFIRAREGVEPNAPFGAAVYGLDQRTPELRRNIRYGNRYMAGLYAIRSARAAFRACPGLRVPEAKAGREEVMPE